jgi:TraB/PrgY/gumN family
MRRSVFHTLALLLVTGLSVADEARTQPDLDVVLVTGEQPGPALWRVSSGDHDLWLLGDVSPLPRKVQWRSQHFEALLANSQEVILHWGGQYVQGSQSAELARANKVAGQPLGDTVSPEKLAHIEAVARIYGVNEPLEDLKPWAVGNRIANASLEALDLRVVILQTSVQALARKARVPTTGYSTPHVPFEEQLSEARDSVNSLCLLERTVQLLEDGGSGLRSLANAWSVGDIDALRRLVPEYGFFTGDRSNECRKQAAEYTALRVSTWLAEAERALRENQSTLAVVPMPELFATDGYLAALRVRGYVVVEPE